MKNNLINIFDYNVFVNTKSELQEELQIIIKENDSRSILSLNTLKLFLGEKNKNLKNLFNSFNYVIPDGQSIVFALSLLFRLKIKAISGAELMVDLIELSNNKNYSIFFLGSSSELLKKVKTKIEKEYLGIKRVEYQDGYYSQKDEKKIIEKISEFSPNILFVAFGSPRKEIFIQENKTKLNANILMGVGGSYEYFVGDVKLDDFTKKIGMRWFLRSVQDPVRLLPRYIKCNTYFIYYLTKEYIKTYWGEKK